MPMLIDSVVAILLVAGSILSLAASLRVLRAASSLDRLQSVVKAGAPGLALLLLAAAFAPGDLTIFLRACASVFVLLLGATISGQMISPAFQDDQATNKDL